jgi:hypothetical protein
MTGYRFSQRLAAAFRSGRVLLAGDAAHVMSPFGARGLNSGVADAENLAWKLARVVSDASSGALLDTYETERRSAAVENLVATDATMRFMAPHGPMRRAWRNLVLRMAPRSAWFRARVNSGRLAEPAAYAASSVIASGPESAALPNHGSVAPDGALSGGRRLRDRLGRGYALIVAGAPRLALEGADVIGVAPGGPYGADRVWLVRPDGYLADSASLADESGVLRVRRAAD